MRNLAEKIATADQISGGALLAKELRMMQLPISSGKNVRYFLPELAFLLDLGVMYLTLYGRAICTSCDGGNNRDDDGGTRLFFALKLLLSTRALKSAQWNSLALPPGRITKQSRG